jgi:subtilisin family serine protease
MDRRCRRLGRALTGLVCALLGAAPALAAAESGAPSQGPIISLPISPDALGSQQEEGEALLVLPKRADGTVASDFELAPGARIVSSYWSPVLCSTIARVAGHADASPSQLVTKLPEDATLAPNHVYATAATQVEPAPDPYRRMQYGLDRLGVDAARPVSSGAGVRVAVLDSAPQADHPDLAGVHVVRLKNGPSDAPAMHGSLTTGVIAAVAKNGFGIAGVAPGAEVIAIPVCKPLGATARDSCDLFDVLRGFDVAVGRRAQILNVSLVGPPNPLLARATHRLDEIGAVVVAAAGNEATEAPRYPAAYASVVGVGAVDAKGAQDPQSNRGLSAEIWAPGTEVLSTVPGGAFAFASGTSFAAAHVSGALAVLIGSGVAPADARRALFHAASARSAGAQTPTIAALCDALERLGHTCPAS